MLVADRVVTRARALELLRGEGVAPEHERQDRALRQIEALRVQIRQRKAELLGAVAPEPRQSVNHARKWQLRG